VPSAIGPLSYRAGVYEIRNLVNGKRYVGSSVDIQGRFGQHRRSLSADSHHSSHLQRAWAKYGSASFVFRPLLLCGKDMLTFYEQLCIDGLTPEYNVCRSVAATRLGLRNSPEQNAKIGAANKGHSKSPELLEQMSRATKDRWLTNPNMKAPPPMSPEVKARVDAGKKGRRQPAAAVAIRAEQAKARMADPEFKRKALAALHSKDARSRAVVLIAEKARASEARERARERMREMWQDPAFRAKTVAATRAAAAKAKGTC
jgi:group I intron endonuclease